MKDLESDKMDAYAREVLFFCDDVRYLQKAAKWSERIIKSNGGNPSYSLTYSQLLHKSGKKKAAIKVMQKAIKLAAPNDIQYLQDELKRLETDT